MSNETVFTKIANKEIPVFIIDENDDFMAFLDSFPSVYAQALVIPKKQMDSYVFKHDSEFMQQYWEYIRKIALLLDERLKTLRTVLMFEGFEVNHLHAKLYPFTSMEEAEAFNPRNQGKLTEETANAIMAKLKL